MPLPPSTARRALKHTRAIRIEAYARDDGLWDIDAHLSDIKTNPMRLAPGVRAPGEPIHELSLRLTIDTDFNVVAAEAASDAVPYAGYCDTVGPAYRTLEGLNLRRGFRHAVKDRLAGTKGCTHLTELAQVLPTAAIQALAPEYRSEQDGLGAGEANMPFQLDRCHALRLDGGAVATYYPRWAVKPVQET